MATKKQSATRQDFIPFMALPGLDMLNQPQWLEIIGTVSKLQQIYMQTMLDAQQHEVEFLAALIEANTRLTQCLWNPGDTSGSADMAACYQSITQDVADAAMKRMNRITDLSDDFRERLWSEI